MKATCQASTNAEQPAAQPANTGPYIARNIGFGLPVGRFFKVEMITNDGPALYTKVGGCFFESEAREFAIAAYAKNLKNGHGLRSTRVNEISQFSAVLFDAPLA